jgi:hypothetical protein
MPVPETTVCKYIRSFWVTNSILDSSNIQNICAEDKTDKTGTKLEANTIIFSETINSHW